MEERRVITGDIHPSIFTMTLGSESRSEDRGDAERT